MRAYNIHGGWAHRQRASTTFLSRKYSHVLLVLLTRFEPRVIKSETSLVLYHLSQFSLKCCKTGSFDACCQWVQLNAQITILFTFTVPKAKETYIHVYNVNSRVVICTLRSAHWQQASKLPALQHFELMKKYWVKCTHQSNHYCYIHVWITKERYIIGF